jgi:hypothetical protein
MAASGRSNRFAFFSFRMYTHTVHLVLVIVGMNECMRKIQVFNCISKHVNNVFVFFAKYILFGGFSSCCCFQTNDVLFTTVMFLYLLFLVLLSLLSNLYANWPEWQMNEPFDTAVGVRGNAVVGDDADGNFWRPVKISAAVVLALLLACFTAFGMFDFQLSKLKVPHIVAYRTAGDPETVQLGFGTLKIHAPYASNSKTATAAKHASLAKRAPGDNSNAVPSNSTPTSFKVKIVAIYLSVDDKPGVTNLALVSPLWLNPGTNVVGWQNSAKNSHTISFFSLHFCFSLRSESEPSRSIRLR